MYSSNPKKKIHYESNQTIQDNEIYIDCKITTNELHLIIPEHPAFLQLKMRTFQLVDAHWQYIEPPDGENQIIYNNPIYEYKEANCKKPINFINIFDGFGTLRAWDPFYHTIEWKCINIYCNLARNTNEKNVNSMLLTKVYKQFGFSQLTENTFIFSALNENSDIIIIPNQTTEIKFKFMMEEIDYGNIKDPTTRNKWQESKEKPLFSLNPESMIQPQPNFNRPLYLKIKICFY